VWDPDAQSWNEPLVEALFSTDTSILALDPSALGDSILVNGDFSTDDADWTFGDWGGDATATVEDGEMVVRLTDPGAVPWDIQLKQMLPPLTEGTEYTLVFDVRADAPRGLAVAIQNQVAWDVHASGTFSAASQFRTQVLNFTMGIDDDQVALVFNCGAETAALYIDNVYLVVSP
jgi:hypothetical protein